MIYLQTVFLILAYYILLFIIGQLKKDNSIVDMVWGFGFLIPAWFTYFQGEKSINALIVTVLVTIWGLRLSYHITKRNWRKGEDFRYVNMRKNWGEHFKLVKAFLHVYILQMLMLMLISASFVHTNLYNDQKLSWISLIGLFIWMIGFVFETLADYQLSQFKKNPSNKGKLLTSGLHRFTRHPNYFGEATMWWGIYVIGLTTNYGPLMLISPIVITVLVRYVSGVPLLEKHYENRADYQAYAKETSIFIPRWKRS